MADICCHCKKRKAGEPKEISFEHAGLKFRSFKSGLCCEECEKEDVIRRFEEFGRKFISSGKGLIKVDWEFFSEAY